MSNLLKTLDETCEKIEQPEDIKIQLKLHQLTSIYKMNYIENNTLIVNENNDILDSIEKYNYHINNNTFNINILKTNIGLLSDKVGAGKTYTILGLICHNKYINDQSKYEMKPLDTVSIKVNSLVKCNNYYSHISLKKETYNNNFVKDINKIENCIPYDNISINTNLIVVPFGIFKQWTDSIANTNLKSYEINKRPKINTLDEDDLCNYDIILITNTMYSTFLNKFSKYTFNRKIIDEANTINLPGISYNDIIHAKFTWLITATPEYFNRRGGRQKRDILNYLPYDFIIDLSYYSYCGNNTSEQYKDAIKRCKYFIVKNNDNYIDQSIILPDIKYYSHICPTPKELNVIKDYLEPELVSMLNAGNYKDALTVLGCDVGDSDNIFNVLTNNIKKSINDTKNKIEAYQISITTEELEPEQVYYMRRQIKEKNELLESLETKYNSLNERINQFYKENCVICMEDLNYENYPSVTPCCNQLICFDCLISMKKTQKVLKCPYCRTIINLKDICVLSNEKDLENEIVENDNENKIKMRKYNKIDILKKILIENPNGKYLIFSEHDESFIKIIALLNNLNVSYREMKGNGMVINKIIESFNNNKIPVLLLNTRHMGAGLNLQSCSDIILFHRQRADLEKQLIGRGQRLGRTESLKVHYLLHDNEQYMTTSEISNYDEIEDN
jgi:hypothetical protein